MENYIKMKEVKRNVCIFINLILRFLNCELSVFKKKDFEYELSCTRFYDEGEEEDSDGYFLFLINR